MAFVLLSPESDEFAKESKKSAIWTSSSTFLLSLYLPLNFDKSIPHFQFVNTFSWFNSDNLRFSLGVDGLSMPFIILSTFSYFAMYSFYLSTTKEEYENVFMLFLTFRVLLDWNV